MVSDDLTRWPTINPNRFLNYFIVSALVGVMYDWALTFGQEIELVWRQRWSLMTVLYLSVRYLGILSAVLSILGDVPTISLTDKVRVGVVLYWLFGSLTTAMPYYHRCFIINAVRNWTSFLVMPILWVIVITRLHAMYQRSRGILIFLTVTFLAVNVFNGVVAVLMMIHASRDEHILSGTYQCSIGYAEDIPLLNSVTWILFIVWEVLTLCLAVWIAVKHFRELRLYSAGGIIEDCFMVLMKTHVLYFASFVAVSCFQLIIDFSPTLPTLYAGCLQIFLVVQIFVLGPRLILGVREYYAKLVADSDAATGLTSIVFQERVHISTGSGV